MLIAARKAAARWLTTVWFERVAKNSCGICAARTFEEKDQSTAGPSSTDCASLPAGRSIPSADQSM